MRMVVGLGVALLLSGSVVLAQDNLAIHGHPQKTTYASPAEWPFVDFQAHFKNPPNGTIPTTLMHVHRGCWLPIYAVVTPSTGLITLSCQDKMFMWDGSILPGGPTHSIKNIVYDGPALVQEMQMNADGSMSLVTVKTVPGSGTDVPTIQQGDPDRLITENFHMTVDPYGIDGNDVTSAWPPHGWSEVWSTLTAQTASGVYIGLQTQFSFWSELDASAPITGNAEGGYPHLMAKVQNNAGFGAVISDFLEPIPLEPITEPWPFSFAQYAYGGNSDPLQNATNLQELSANLNLHLGNEGTQIFLRNGVGIQPDFFPPDKPFWVTPSMLGGAGSHLLALRWKIDGGVPGFPAGEEIWSLVTITVPVAPGASDVIPGPTPPPPPPPPTTPPIAFTASASTVTLGQSYTLTAVIDESQDAVHNVAIDGIGWGSLGCTINGTIGQPGATVTCQLVRTPPAAGTITDVVTAVNSATGSDFAPLTITVQVQ